MYPIRYEADYIEPQDRAKAFFRWILFIPWYILASLYGIAAFVVAFLAWFALLFTGRYPQGLYNFNAGFLRFTGRFAAFAFLQTEQWPPFGFDDDRRYQIRVDVDPPLPNYNRWKVFFRLIVGIPAMFMVYLFQCLYYVAAAIAWFHIVFMGRTSGGVHNALTLGLAYQLRTLAYFLLMTETLPPVSDQAPAAEEPAPRKAIGKGAAAAAIAPATKSAASKKPAAAKKSSARASATRKPAAKKKVASKKPGAAKAAPKKTAAKPAARRKPASGKS